MATNRNRASHVRPRPPSTGRPREIRAAAPSVRRVRQHPGIQGRRRKLPLASRLVLVAAILALGATVMLTALGAIGPIVASLGRSLDGALGQLTATAQPSASIVVATDSPIIAAPEFPATNAEDTSLRVVVPADVAGTDAHVRVYLALEGLDPAPIAEVEVGSTPQVVVPVHLTDGRNDFTATIVRDGAESEPSAVVTIVLDREAPKIVIAAPKNNATVDLSEAAIRGTTQAASDLIAHNGANGASVTTSADGEGKFTIHMPLDPGANEIEIRATDPAGNSATTTLRVNQGSADLRASLRASLYQIRVSKPPSSLQLSVTVTDPSGAPVEGAQATFTLQIPGLAPISNTLTTGSNGRATFTAALVGEMKEGNGLATVLVTHADFGDATDRVSLLFVK